ncbi:ribonuclease HII [cf. Phormidesmis sp. LEGE 11477]|uniref:ribonuclease HII n=1 Tax=cf. Phormidesmis sp. LEGE 11477 TaxID=1828680 RepID=UPI00187FD218|nr:ribonuclease HII [cf. Phormidesmis sp. LEGE 11477]
MLHQPNSLQLRYSESLDKLSSKSLEHRTAGVDEVGRGALFGPVVAAAVVIPDGTAATFLESAGVTDSKALSAEKRTRLAVEIRALTNFGVGLATAYEVDRINILQASLLAMRRAIFRLSPLPDKCLIDGNQPIRDLSIEQETVVKGDRSVLAIAAASILAKVWRDELIVRLDRQYPGYDLASNKGYGSAKHRAGIARQGICRQHRQSFKSCQKKETGCKLSKTGFRRA